MRRAAAAAGCSPRRKPPSRLTSRRNTPSRPTQQSDAQPQCAPDAPSSGRGLFNAQRAHAQPQVCAAGRRSHPTCCNIIRRRRRRALRGRALRLCLCAARYEQSYTLDSGDKLRVVVFGQQGISGTYPVDAGGNITLPLAGTIPARHFTTRQLARTITDRLKQGYVREPHVTVTIEAYRPFFILGEVTTPGQYPYVPNMTVENAVAVAGGFAPRAKKQNVELTRNAGRQLHQRRAAQLSHAPRRHRRGEGAVVLMIACGALDCHGPACPGHLVSGSVRAALLEIIGCPALRAGAVMIGRRCRSPASYFICFARNSCVRPQARVGGFLVVASRARRKRSRARRSDRRKFPPAAASS